MRASIKEPIPAIFEAWADLQKAVDHHIAGDRDSADKYFRRADSAEVWGWTNPGILKPYLHVVEPRPKGDTQVIPKADRDPDRNIAPAIKKQVLERDGFRCRYCGIPVVPADVRKAAHRLYPEAVRWQDNAVSSQHAAFQCLWLQYDHVDPLSHGGRSTVENVVISCALCNYGKDRYTLRQLALEDPRLRPPEPTDWDGLLRFLSAATAGAPGTKSRTPSQAAAKLAHAPESRDSFFIPGAWISRGYLYTPPLAGKERWFRLGADVWAETASKDGVVGCRLVCEASLLRKRGIDPSVIAGS